MFKMVGMEELTLLDPVVLPDFVCDFREINILLLVFLSVNNNGLHRRACHSIHSLLDALCVVCSVLKSQKEIFSSQCPSSAKFWKSNCTCQLCVSP